MKDRPQYAVREQLPLPTRPPYTAHLGNLAYDVKQSDVEDFLAECQVTSVRIVEDKFDHKPKGFGYVEFSTLDGLKAALTKSETSFMGRNIKISVAEPRMYHHLQACNFVLTSVQPRTGRSLRATSPIGRAKARFLTCHPTLGSHRIVASAETSTLHLMPGVSVAAAEGQPSSPRVTARPVTSATGSVRVRCRQHPLQAHQSVMAVD